MTGRGRFKEQEDQRSPDWANNIPFEKRRTRNVSNPVSEKLNFNQSISDNHSPKSDPLNFDYSALTEVCKIEDSSPIRAGIFSPNGEYFAIGTNSKAL